MAEGRVVVRKDMLKEEKHVEKEIGNWESAEMAGKGYRK